MGSGWMKSLQCKSRALEDVALINNPNHLKHLLISSSSCRRTAQTIKDVVVLDPKKKQKPTPHPPSSKPKPKPKPKPKSNTVTTPTTTSATNSSSRETETVSYRRSVSEQALTSLTDLPEGHPSRNVVEIIFHTSWGSYNCKPFSGRVELVFKVHNAQRTISRFEDYRLKVSSRVVVGGTAKEDARCAADGNEMMRFHCLGPTVEYSGAGSWGFPKGAGICTFSGSGKAHESAGGGESGRRAMLVCRVIAGRVSKRVGQEGIAGFDSASGENGQLVVFDPRAVLPCFLVIYKL